MIARHLLLGAMLALASLPATAQGTTPLNLFGTVATMDAHSIGLQPDAGGAVEHYALAPNLVVVQARPATLADIQPNDFVASAAVHGADGKLHSTELRIFPAAMRGVGEGQRPMNDARSQTMTNATVTGAAVVNGSNDIRVKFEGGESELILDPGVPVTRLSVVDPSVVVNGTKVRVQGMQTTDGGTVNRITVQ